MSIKSCFTDGNLPTKTEIIVESMITETLSSSVAFVIANVRYDDQRTCGKKLA